MQKIDGIFDVIDQSTDKTGDWQGVDAMHVNINICQLINELIKF